MILVKDLGADGVNYHTSTNINKQQQFIPADNSPTGSLTSVALHSSVII